MRVSKGAPLFIETDGLEKEKLYRENFSNLVILLDNIFIMPVIPKYNSYLHRMELRLRDDVLLAVRIGLRAGQVQVVVENNLPEQYDFLIQQAFEGAQLRLVRMQPPLELTLDLRVWW